MTRELSLFSGLAVKGVLERSVLPGFVEAAGCSVRATFEPTTILERMIAEGARPDVVVGVKDAVRGLAAAGLLDPATLAPLVRSGIGIAVVPGSTPPAIGTAEELASALRAARSVAYSRSGASGVYFARLLERLGIAEQVNERACILPGGFTAEALLDGRADLAVQQVIELASVPGVRILGPLPDEVQHYVELWVGAATGAGVDAEALLEHLASASAARSYREAGLSPAAREGDEKPENEERRS